MMTTMPRQVARYVLWETPGSAPPLPPKRREDAINRGIDIASPIAHDASPRAEAMGLPLTEDARATAIHDCLSCKESFAAASLTLPLRGDGGGANADKHLNGRVGGVHGSFNRFKLEEYPEVTGIPGGTSAESRAVQEVVANPSGWLLRNRETGQEIEAKSFVELLVQHATRRVPQQTWSTSSPQLGPTRGGWMTRRHRSNGQLLCKPRPTLLPAGEDILPPAPDGPPSPPALQLASRVMSRSPPRARGRSSLPGSSYRFRSHSSHARSNSGTSSIFAAANDVASFKLSNLNTAQIVPQLHRGGVLAVSFSPSGEFLATAGADHLCCVFRVHGGFSQSRKTLDEGSPNSGGERLSRWESGATMRQLIDDEPLRMLSGHVGDIVALSWAPDDSALLTGSADGTVRCWHPLDSGECTMVYEHGGRVTAVEWDPSSMRGMAAASATRGRFLTGCMDAKLRLFSAGDPEPEDLVLADNPVTAVSFAPGGLKFVAGFVGGRVSFYRTDGLVQVATTECRRHGIRHSASQHARHAASPVRRLSVGRGGRMNGSGNGGGRGRGRGRRRRSTMGGGSAARRNSGAVEERVTGLCFRPRRTGLGEISDWSWKSERAQRQSSSGDTLGSASRSITEDVDDLMQERAPAANIEVGVAAVPANGSASEGEAHPWGRVLSDVLVSTNDSRTRILVWGSDGGVSVGFKLKGHNTDGVLGRHAVARYSDDGELVISGSADGNVHVWPTPAREINASKRGASRSSGREGHQRAQVCDKTVPVPVALFAPSSVASNLGGDMSRVVVTGDEDGSLKVFVG